MRGGHVLTGARPAPWSPERGPGDPPPVLVPEPEPVRFADLKPGDLFYYDSGVGMGGELLAARQVYVRTAVPPPAEADGVGVRRLRPLDPEDVSSRVTSN